MRSRSRRGGAQPMLKIPEKIVERLQPYRESNRAEADTGCPEVFVAELAVSRAGWVDDQALGIADIGQVAPESQRFDEALARLSSTLEIEGEDGARPPRKVALGQLMVGTLCQSGIVDALHLRLCGQEARHALGVLRRGAACEWADVSKPSV